MSIFGLSLLSGNENSKSHNDIVLTVASGDFYFQHTTCTSVRSWPRNLVNRYHYTITGPDRCHVSTRAEQSTRFTVAGKSFDADEAEFASDRTNGKIHLLYSVAVSVRTVKVKGPSRLLKHITA